MFKYEKDFQKASELSRKNPNKPLNQILKEGGINAASYYAGKKKAENKSQKMNPPKAASKIKKNRSIVVDRNQSNVFYDSSDNQMIMLIGSPEQMRSALSGHL